MVIHTPDRSIRSRQYVVKLEHQPGSVQKKSLARTSLPRNMKSEPVDDIESGSLGTFNGDDDSDITSETPLLLSSTGTASSSSSPGTNEAIWDSPLPSSHSLSSACSNITLTPLTPLSAHYAAPDSAPTFPAKYVEKGTARDAVATKVWSTQVYRKATMHLRSNRGAPMIKVCYLFSS